MNVTLNYDELEDICKKYKCNVCGKEEYKKYIGTTETDGGFTTINKFEPTTFYKWHLDDGWFYICPDCRSACLKAFDKIRDSKRNIVC